MDRDPLAELRPIRTILAATGVTPESSGGVLLAQSLAPLLGARLLALHVVEPVSTEQDRVIPGLAAAHRDYAAREVETFARAHGLSLAPTTDAPTATPLHIATGAAEDQILRALREHNADLVVIGRYGHAGRRHGQLGSIVGRIVRSSPVSVLAVLPTFRGPIRRIAAACDFAPQSAPAVRRAVELARRLGLPEVLLLHSYELPRGYHRISTYEDACQRLDQWARSSAATLAAHLGVSLASTHDADTAPPPSHTPRLRLQTTHGGSGGAIPELAVSEAVDLLVVSADGPTRPPAFMLERKVEKMLQAAACSVWLEKSPDLYHDLPAAIGKLIH